MFATVLMLVPAMTLAGQPWGRHRPHPQPRQHWYHYTAHIDNQCDFDINFLLDGVIQTIPANGTFDCWNDAPAGYWFNIRFNNGVDDFNYRIDDGDVLKFQPSVDGSFNLYQ